MAKREKKDGEKPAGSPAGAPPADPRLTAALETFKRGDYVKARALLEPLVSDSTLAEGERKVAASRLAATRLDAVVPKTALAGLALLLLAIVLTSLIQP